MEDTREGKQGRSVCQARKGSHYTKSTWHAEGQANVLRIIEPKPRKRHLGCGELSTYKPQDCFSGAAVLKRNHIANFMTNINIHLVRYPQGQLDCRLLVDLCAYHAPVLVIDGKAIFSTPLRNLWQGKMTQDQPLLGKTDKLKTQRSSSFLQLASCSLRSFSFTS